MKIFDKHQFVKAAYIEAKKRSIFPIKKGSTMIEWIKILEDKKIHYAYKDQKGSRVYTQMEIEIVLYLLERRKSTTSEKMDNDLKLLVENCKVRTYEEVLSDAKLQQIDNPQIKKEKDIPESRHVNIIFEFINLLEKANNQWDKDKEQIEKKNSWLRLFGIKITKRNYLKKYIKRNMKDV